MIGEVGLGKRRVEGAKLRVREPMLWARASITGGTATRAATGLPVSLLPGVSSLFEAGGTEGGTLKLDLAREGDNLLEEVAEIDGSVAAVLCHALKSMGAMRRAGTAADGREAGPKVRGGASTALEEGGAASVLPAGKKCRMGIRRLTPAEMERGREQREPMESKEVVETIGLEVRGQLHGESLGVGERYQGKQRQDGKQNNQPWSGGKEEEVERLRPRAFRPKLGDPSMVVKDQGVRLVLLGPSSVPGGPMGCRPTGALGTPVPGSAADGLGFRLVCVGRCVFPRRVALGTLLATTIATGGVGTVERAAAAVGGLSLSLFVGLLTFSGHVALFPTVEALNATLVHATGNQVVGLRIRGKVTEGARSCFGIRVVACRRPFTQTLEAAVLVGGGLADVEVGTVFLCQGSCLGGRVEEPDASQDRFQLFLEEAKAKLELLIACPSSGKESIEHVHGQVFGVLTGVAENEGVFSKLLGEFCDVLSGVICRVAILQLRLQNLVTLDGRACEDGCQVGVDNWKGVFVCLHAAKFAQELIVETLEQILDGITIIGMIVCIVKLKLRDYRASHVVRGEALVLQNA